MQKKKCTAIVLAAGQGRRMGTKTQKQYLEIIGKPVLCQMCIRDRLYAVGRFYGGDAGIYIRGTVLGGDAGFPERKGKDTGTKNEDVSKAIRI